MVQFQNEKNVPDTDLSVKYMDPDPGGLDLLVFTRHQDDMFSLRYLSGNNQSTNFTPHVRTYL